MNLADAFIDETNRYRRNMGLEPLGFGDAVEIPEDTTPEATARNWLERCRESVESAREVMKEIEITEHGNFVPLVMHLLANVGTYTNRDKLVLDAGESLDATLLECAGQ